MEFIDTSLSWVGDHKIIILSLLGAVWAYFQFKGKIRLPKMGKTSDPRLSDLRSIICTPEHLKCLLDLEECWRNHHAP
jgi:hypothetical protein